MRHFALRLLMLWLLLAALCGSVVAFRRANAGPNGLQAWGFDRCDGVPCYLRIRPGVTTLKDAEAILASRPLIEVGGALNTENLPTPCDGKLMVCSIVYRYDYYLESAPITAGTLVEQYGTPYAVTYNDSNDIEFHYPGMLAFVRVVYWDHLNVDSPLAQITLLPDYLPDLPVRCQHGAASNLRTVLCWRGFTSYFKSPGR
jgi:hypothetical protein